MYCICCEKNKITPLDFYDESVKREEELLWQKEVRDDGTIRTIDNQMVEGGIIQLIDAGYGSTHDGERFILGICDSCIKEKLDELFKISMKFCLNSFLEKPFSY